MASILPQRFDDLELTELPARAQHHLKLRQQQLTSRLGKLQRDVTRRRQLFVGKLHDDSLSVIYTRGSDVVEAASALFEMAPSGAPVDASVRRLESVSARLTSRLNGLETPPIALYDKLNVKQVNDALIGLDAHALKKVARHERAHKNRVTVLREVERLMTR